MTENPAITKMKKEARAMQSQLENPNSIDKNTPSASDIINKNHGKKTNIEKKICGKAYNVRKYNLKEWMYITPYVGSRVGPSAALLFNKEASGPATGISELFNHLEDGGFEEMVTLLVSTTSLEGELITLDTFESPAEMLEVVMEVIKVNYEDVFTKGMNAMLSLVGNVTAVTNSLKTSQAE